MFDCFGAGQQLTQVTFGGRTWREDPALAAAQFAVLPVMRQLHEILWYLAEALALPAAAPLHAEVARPAGAPRCSPPAAPRSSTGLDVGAHRAAGRRPAASGSASSSGPACPGGRRTAAAPT